MREPKVREALKWLRSGAFPDRLPYGIADPFDGMDPRPGYYIERYTTLEVLMALKAFGREHKYIRNVQMKLYKWEPYNVQLKEGHRRFWRYRGDRSRIDDIEKKLPETANIWPIKTMREYKEVLENPELQTLFRKLYNNFMSVAEIPKVTDHECESSAMVNSYYFGMAELLHMLIQAPYIKRSKEDENFYDKAKIR